MTYSAWDVQKALYEKLTADIPLIALITGVYDYVPESAAYPFLTLHENEGRDWSTATTTGVELRPEIRVYSREGGKKEAEAVLQRLHTILHLQPLTVSGQNVIMVRYLSSAVTLQDDGRTWRAVMRLRVLVHS